MTEIFDSEHCEKSNIAALASSFMAVMTTSLALAYVATGIVAFFIFYRLFCAPLAKVPGPRITAITGVYVMYHEFRGNRTLILDRLHAQYGPVVRVSPTEVSFNDTEALKQIYGIKSNYSKSRFYDMFVYYNERNTFTSLGRGDVSA